MSAEKHKPFEREYIRLTERFKALSTFAQFLQGIHRAFLPIQVGPALDLGSLYEDVKALSGRIQQNPPERVERMIREISAKLETAAGKLRQADMALSPSLTRRYFERVRPADERIPFYLLRFYLGQSETDDNLLDKVDYLATVAAAGTQNPGAAVVRSREEIRTLFEKLAGASATSTGDEVAPEIAKAFDELATQIAATRGFEDLAGEGWIESLRTLKRRIARGMAHPQILAAAVSCNLTARTVFQSLYEKEEDALREATDRITELEHQALPMEDQIEVALRRFRESQSAVESQTAQGTVRWRQLLELHQATVDAMKLVAGWNPESEASRETPSPEGGLPLDENADPFWGPCLRQLLVAVQAAQEENPAPSADFCLESWETDVALRSIAATPLTKPETAVLLGAALRVKTESEIEAALGGKETGIPPNVMREARATLSHVSEIDRTIGELVAAQRPPDASDEDVRRWMRTRLRLLHAASALWLELDRPS